MAFACPALSAVLGCVSDLAVVPVHTGHDVAPRIAFAGLSQTTNRVADHTDQSDMASSARVYRVLGRYAGSRSDMAAALASANTAL